MYQKEIIRERRFAFTNGNAIVSSADPAFDIAPQNISDSAVSFSLQFFRS
jgi:hypothetical protein